jgi:hypothetical protein
MRFPCPVGPRRKDITLHPIIPQTTLAKRSLAHARQIEGVASSPALASACLPPRCRRYDERPLDLHGLQAEGKCAAPSSHSIAHHFVLRFVECRSFAGHDLDGGSGGIEAMTNSVDGSFKSHAAAPFPFWCLCNRTSACTTLPPETAVTYYQETQSASRYNRCDDGVL